MTPYGYALLGLTALVSFVVAFLTFALLKFATGAREARRRITEGGGGEAALLSAALQDSVARLKTQEQAMTARAVASERLSGLIVESLTAGLLVIDQTGRVDIVNPAARRMLDLADEPLGIAYRETLMASPALADVIAECLADGRPILRRTVHIGSARGTAHFGVTVSPLGGSGAHGVICLFSDLTTVVELEDQLRLKETLATLGELTAGIAHEFRNGLATIHGYSRLVDPASLPATYRPYIEGIRQETEALGQIVTNFLNFARPEKPSFAPVALDRLVRRVSDELRHELPESATVAISGDFCEIQGDEVLLRQVFGNLMRNAVEACEAAGVRPAISIEGSVDRGRGVCRVTVADNGPGIPEEDRTRVFQPFFTTRSRGTGLGLALVQKIVVTHSGRVTAGAAPSGGASIDVTFPIS